MMLQLPPSYHLRGAPKDDPMHNLREAGREFLFGQSPEMKAVRTISLMSAGAFVGAPVVARFATATRPVRNIMTWINHPIAKTLATRSSYKSVQLGAQGYLHGMKAVRYTSYAAGVYSPFETYRYLKAGDIKRAGLQWWGPPGTVYVYNQLTMDPVNSPARMEELKKLGMPGKTRKAKPSLKTKKKSSMTAKQRRRLNRMGLRYCPVHRRYDRCARKK